MKLTFIAMVSALAIFLIGCNTGSVNDATITTAVKSKLAADPGTSAARINVDTSSGVVTLSGSVPTVAERSEAERIARTTQGVRQVINNITVQQEQPMVQETPTGTPPGTPSASPGGGAMLSDATILTSIKSKLVANRILGTNVDVNNGEVTITGEVENAQEKAKAGEIARQAAGVKSVRNQLTIKRK
jgi:osmotically-inducible protein OsmY